MVLRAVSLFSPGSQLSVLALSSRFDGQPNEHYDGELLLHFQYSLCRVVLMVPEDQQVGSPTSKLSVLALSSRFDGLRDFC